MKTIKQYIHFIMNFSLIKKIQSSGRNTNDDFPPNFPTFRHFSPRKVAKRENAWRKVAKSGEKWRSARMARMARMVIATQLLLSS